MQEEHNDQLDALSFLMIQAINETSDSNQSIDGLKLDELKNNVSSIFNGTRIQPGILNKQYMRHLDIMDENKKKYLFETRSVEDDFNQQYMLNTQTNAKYEDEFERLMRIFIEDIMENKLLRADILNLDYISKEESNGILNEIQKYNSSLSNLVKNYIRSGSANINEYKNSYLKKTNIYLVKKYLETVIEKKIKQKYSLDKRDIDLINFQIIDFDPMSVDEILSFEIFTTEKYNISIQNNGNPVGAFSNNKKRFQISGSYLKIKKCSTNEYYINTNEDNSINMSMQTDTVKAFNEYYAKNNSPTGVLENQLTVDSYSEYDRKKIKLTERVIDTIKINRQLIVTLIQMYFNSNPIEVYASLNKAIIQEKIEINIQTCERFINIATAANNNLNEVILSR